MDTPLHFDFIRFLLVKIFVFLSRKENRIENDSYFITDSALLNSQCHGFFRDLVICDFGITDKITSSLLVLGPCSLPSHMCIFNIFKAILKLFEVYLSKQPKG